MELFGRFLPERTCLKGVSPETLRYYRWVCRAFQTILAQRGFCALHRLAQRAHSRPSWKKPASPKGRRLQNFHEHERTIVVRKLSAGVTQKCATYGLPRLGERAA